MEVLIFIGIVIVTIAIFSYSLYAKKKRRQDRWSGVVIDKKIEERIHTNDSNSRASGTVVFGNNQAVTHSYKITVKTDDGRQLDWPTSSGFYESVQIGDKLTKEVDTEIPTITLNAQSIPPQPIEQINQNQSPPPFNPNLS